MDILVSTDWLAGEIGKPDLVILDASLFLPGTPRDPRAEFDAAHIPGAAFMDLPSLSDPADPVPGQLPPDALMTQRMQALGVNADSRIVVYDNSPTHSAARGWWMMRVYGLGADQGRGAAILDGGLPKWVAEGRQVDSGTPAIALGNAVARLDRTQVRSKADILANLDSGTAQLLDARGAGRFTGAEAEPRPGMAIGPYPRQPQHPLLRLLRRRQQPEAGRGTAPPAAGRRHRSRPADHHHLRQWRHRGDHPRRARNAREARRQPL